MENLPRSQQHTEAPDFSALMGALLVASMEVWELALSVLPDDQQQGLRALHATGAEMVSDVAIPSCRFRGFIAPAQGDHVQVFVREASALSLPAEERLAQTALALWSAKLGTLNRAERLIVWHALQGAADCVLRVHHGRDEVHALLRDAHGNEATIYGFQPRQAS